MNILIVGNLGYVGFVLSDFLKKNISKSKLFGYDNNYFNLKKDLNIDKQYYGDVRNFNDQILDTIDIVIYLAAISNDPMGNAFEEATMNINCYSAYNIARLSKQNKIKHFIFASSCSVYGLDDGNLKNEASLVNPLTTYAKSKIEAENKLHEIQSEEFLITNLRFATATGYSPNMRLDLVLNDFVASAISLNKIEIMSNGEPLRPLIHVKDMSRAIYWSIYRTINEGGSFLTMNIGSNEMNYKISELATNIKLKIKNLEIVINHNAPEDKRSYQVDFTKFKKLAGAYLPEYDLNKTLNDLIVNLSEIENLSEFRGSNFIRLNALNSLIKNKKLSPNLEWN
jgi:nucleoside-diphosphate-sugar epimerase